MADLSKLCEAVRNNDCAAMVAAAREVAAQADAQPAVADVPEGWVMVPKVPTEEMLRAMLKEAGGCTLGDSSGEVYPATDFPQAKTIYAAMLSAAPAAPQVADDPMHEQVMKERDECEEVIDQILDLVLGPDREEWSSAYGYADAILDVGDRMRDLDYHPVQEGDGYGEGWSGWAIQYPGKLPKLYGAEEIARLNWAPDAGADLVQLAEVDRVTAGDWLAAAKQGEVSRG
jgi:hypothetical protein